MSASTDGERGGEFYPSANDHVNADGAAPVVLVCEHASNYLPTRYRGLGLPKQELSRHIAWDIGAAELTRHLATRLGAIAFLAGASRLLVDCNRPLDSPRIEAAIGPSPVVAPQHLAKCHRGWVPNACTSHEGAQDRPGKD
jgi:predicted N-formylglutamate amidohydrolase